MFYRAMFVVILFILYILWDSYKSHENQYKAIISCKNNCLSTLSVEQIIGNIKSIQVMNERQKLALDSLLKEDEAEFSIINKGEISSLLDRLLLRRKFVVLIFKNEYKSYRAIVFESCNDLYVSEIVVTQS